MKIISFVTQKGGSGKTMLAVNCAVAAEQTRRKVFLLDLDPQATAEAWYQEREAETPKLAHIKASGPVRLACMSSWLTYRGSFPTAPFSIP